MKFKFSLGFIAVAILAGACGNQKSNDATSSVSDVAMPGDPNGDNFLLWIDQGKLFRANCTKNAPVNRANCTTNPTSKTVEEAKKFAKDTGAADVLAAQNKVTAEIKRLKDSDPTVVALNQSIQTLTRQKNDLTASSGALGQALTKNKELKANYEAFIKDNDQQIAAIDARLEQTPDDQELIALRAKIVGERAVTQKNLDDVSALIANQEARLEWENSTLAAVSKELADKQELLKATYDGLVVQSPQLDAFRKEHEVKNNAVAAIDPMFELIGRSDITYRQNTLNSAQQMALTWIANGAPNGLIKAGRYIVESGYSGFCPQNVDPQMVGGVMKSVKLTYLSPCGGVTENYVCNGTTCSVSSSRLMVIQSFDHYKFTDSGSTAIFKFER